MATQIKMRRGTTAQHTSFTGSEAEITVDTTKDTVVVHDGSTAGGIPLATEAANNAKLPKSGGTMTGVIAGFESTGIDDNSTSTAITIDSSENVGIGVVPKAWHSDYAGLQVGDGSALSGKTTGDASFFLSNAYRDSVNNRWEYIGTNGSQPATSYQQSSGKHFFQVAPSGTADAAISWNTAMTIDNSGNVGIGTATPKRQAHIHNPAGTTTKLQITNATTGGTSDGDGFQVGIGNDGTAYVEQRENLPLILTTNNNERMRIDESGNVGIGVAPKAWHSDYAGLQVGDGSALSGKTTGDASFFLSNAYRDSVNNRWEYIGTNGSQPATSYQQSSGQHFFQVASSGTADAAISWTTAMTIDNSGNVGIGVTPETGWQSYTALRVGGVASLWSSTAKAANGHTQFGNNVYRDSSGADKYIVTDEASKYRQGAGGHYFSVAPSGSADAAISFTDTLTIANSGDVDIGALSTTGATTGVKFRNSGNEYELRTSLNTTNSRAVMTVYNPNGSVGSITASGSATSYNTSSDYRLKTNVLPMTGATATFKQLKPVNFEWIADGSRVDGFLAHQLQEVIPCAATGTKDGMRDEVFEVSPATGDIYTAGIAEVTAESQVMETVETGSYVNLAGETIIETTEKGVTTNLVETVVQRHDVDGVSTEIEVEVTTQVPTMEMVITTEAVAEVIHSSDAGQQVDLEDGQLWRETTAQVMGTRSVPDMQGIDQAKVVPLLTAALQEAIAKIESLEARLTELEDNE